MRVKVIITALLLLTSMCAGVAQQKEHARVSFDPRFWNHELHLTQKQLRRLDDIHYQFYEELHRACSDHTKPSYKFSLHTALTRRSEQLEQVFTRRQQKKWAKIFAKQLPSR